MNHELIPKIIQMVTSDDEELARLGFLIFEQNDPDVDDTRCIMRSLEAAGKSQVHSSRAARLVLLWAFIANRKYNGKRAGYDSNQQDI